MCNLLIGYLIKSTGYAFAAGPSGDCSMEERRAVEMYGKMWRQVPHGEQYQDCSVLASEVQATPNLATIWFGLITNLDCIMYLC